MDEPEKISMWRKVGRSFERVIDAIFVKAVDWVVHLCRAAYGRHGLRRLFWFIGAILIAVLVAQLVDTLTEVKPDNKWLDEKVTTAVRNYGLLVAAVVGLFFGVWRTVLASRQTVAAQQQAELTEQGQITDRYTEAVKMLSDNNARTRVGAVYALARIAQDSTARDHIPVMEVLTEFIRNPPYQEKANARAEARHAEKEASGYDPAAVSGYDPAAVSGYDPAAVSGIGIPPAVQCPDIQAALVVIADRNDEQKAREAEEDFIPSLEDAKLGDLDLNRASLAGARLRNATLTGADLSFAKLTGADLTFATLTGANLFSATLTGAELTFANLTGANLNYTILSGADLAWAELTGADLSSAELDGATKLTQNQIDECRPSDPPRSLPDDLDWPFEMVSNEWQRREQEQPE